MSDSGASPIHQQSAYQSHVSANQSQAASEAAMLQLEMRRISERRRELEAQRSQLSRSRPASAAPSGRRSMSQSGIVHDPPGATHTEIIAPEHRRLESMPRTASREMKEAMKESWYHDSALVQGYFLTKPLGKAGTFSRAQRFQNPVGFQNYYLSNDVQTMQSRRVRFDGSRYSVTTRGNLGTNVNSRWNDSKGGAAPGPGAYTPRWSSASSGPKN